MIEMCLETRKYIRKQNESYAALNMGSLKDHIKNYGRDRDSLDYQEKNDSDAIKNIDRTIWMHLAEKTNLFSLMSAQSQSDWRSRVNYGNDFPEATRENIISTFEELHANKGSIFQQSVLDVAKSLNVYCYKTNKPLKFGKKIIKSMACDSRFGFLSVGYNFTNELNDLERCLDVITGKQAKNHRGEMVSAKLSDHKGFDQLFESLYFNIKFCKNGNAHIIFNDQLYVDGLNKVISLGNSSKVAREVSA
ncbi:DUF4942 domain-containing protein [Cysteiniphilum litorale]|nr:DUF4942 domain-containing protein [Cysteiniphilum litorale]